MASHPKEEYLEPSLTVVQISNPLGDLEHHKKKEILNKLALEGERQFESSLKRITTELLPQLVAIHTIAHFAFYDHLIIPSLRKGKNKSDQDYQPLHQAHIEILQAIIAKYPAADAADRMPPNFPQILEDLSSEIRLLLESFSLRRASSETTFFLEGLRQHTTFVRNWGDTEQVFTWLEELFKPFDKYLEDKIGISFSNLIKLTREFLYLIEQRIENRRKELREILLHSNTQDMLSSYLELSMPNPESESHITELDKINQLSYTREQLKSILLTHRDLSLHETFLVKKEDFSKDHPPEEIDGFFTALQTWSSNNYDWSNKDISHIFMDNPIWENPVIQIEHNEFFWPLPHLFQSFGLEMLTNLLDPTNRTNFETNIKADYLEDKLVSLLRKYFPTARIYQSSHYADSRSNNSAIYENDCFLLIDSICLVFEAKSGRLRPSAKRGSLTSFTDGLRKTFKEGAAQATRFIEALKNGNPISNKDGNKIDIDTNQIHHFVPIVVTFEHFGDTLTNKTALIEAGLLDSEMRSTPCICLPDLERVLQILPSVSQRLHYLVNRPFVETHLSFRGDELDLLVFYLKTGFAIGDKEKHPEGILVLSGLSKNLDDYILDRSDKTPRPSRFLTSRWKRIINQLEDRQIPGWCEVMLIFLGADKQSMWAAEKRISAIENRLRNRKHKQGEDDIFICINGSKEDQKAFGIAVGSRTTSEQRRNHANTALSFISEAAGEIDAAIIYIDTSSPITGYHSLYFAKAGKWSTDNS